jgi:hypothetical protein
MALAALIERAKARSGRMIQFRCWPEVSRDSTPFTRSTQTTAVRTRAEGDSCSRGGCGAQLAVLKRRQVSSPWSFPLASVAFGYLPILLFLIVA